MPKRSSPTRETDHSRAVPRGERTPDGHGGDVTPGHGQGNGDRAIKPYRGVEAEVEQEGRAHIEGEVKEAHRGKRREADDGTGREIAKEPARPRNERRGTGQQGEEVRTGPSDEDPPEKKIEATAMN